MQIEKAYLFGRQMTEGTPPSPMDEDVYFENGRFNPLYVPSTFNYKNHVYSIDEQETSDIQYITFDPGFLESGYTIYYKMGEQNMYNPQISFEIANGAIRIHYVLPQSSFTSNQYWGNSICFPIVNYASFCPGAKQITVRYRLVVNSWNEDNNNDYFVWFHPLLAANDPPTRLQLARYSGSFELSNKRNTTGFDWKSLRIRPYAGQIPIYLNFMLSDGYNEKAVNGDTDFIVEIDKVWAT